VLQCSILGKRPDKLTDKSEEEEDGKTVIREKKRFSNELTLVFCTGEIANLK